MRRIKSRIVYCCGCEDRPANRYKGRCVSLFTLDSELTSFLDREGKSALNVRPPPFISSFSCLPFISEDDSIGKRLLLLVHITKTFLPPPLMPLRETCFHVPSLVSESHCCIPTFFFVEERGSVIYRWSKSCFVLILCLKVEHVLVSERVEEANRT